MEDEKVILELGSKKKHSVRFNNPNSDVLKSVYLINEAFERMDEPQGIVITICPSDHPRKESNAK